MKLWFNVSEVDRECILCKNYWEWAAVQLLMSGSVCGCKGGQTEVQLCGKYDLFLG